MSRKPSTQPASDMPEKEPYEVGYGKPPKHTRFKPGQSGNPKGRPRGACNLRTAFTKALQETVTIREGDKTRKLSKARAIIEVTVNNALKSDPKALTAVMQLARSAGLLDEEPDASAAQSMSAEDQAILAAFLERQGIDPSALSKGDPGIGIQRADGETGAGSAQSKADHKSKPEDQA